MEIDAQTSNALLDIVPGMLEQARRKSAGLPIRWVEAGARAFEIRDQFRLIFLAGNAFQAFVSNAKQVALLPRVCAHLHDDGLFVFETRNPQHIPAGTCRVVALQWFQD